MCQRKEKPKTYLAVGYSCGLILVPNEEEKEEVMDKAKRFKSLSVVPTESAGFMIWLKKHAGSWRQSMTAPKGFIFPCCGEIKGLGNNNESDVCKAEGGWIHNVPDCRGIILMEFPEIMESEFDYRFWQREKEREKEGRRRSPGKWGYFVG